MRSIDIYMTAILLTGGLVNIPSASPVLADEPPAPPPAVQESTAPASEGATPPPESGEVRERGFGPARLPQSSMPGTASLAPINAGTPSLTAIANQIQLTHKSVSIRVDVPGGLSLPVPVEVTAKFVVYGYSSPELKGIYGAGGIHLIHHMPDKPMIPGGGSGPLAHKVMVYLTLRETDQTARSFSFPVRQIIITPLYDINLFNMTFQLMKGCDSWIRGKNDIHLDWRTPNGRFGVEIFKLHAGETKRVPAFDWFAKEAQQVNLLEPRFAFREADGIFELVGPQPFGPANQLQVVAGRHRAEIEVKEAEGQGCTAQIAYTIFRKLLTF